MQTSHTSWWYRGWLVGLLLAASLTGSAYANAQLLYLSGGATPETGAQVGSRLWLSDLFQIQGAVNVQGRVSAEATLLFRPFAHGGAIEPYVFAGIGGFLDEGVEERVAPMGAGIEYHLSEQFGIFAEIAGRWSLEDEKAYRQALDLEVVPSFGVSWRVSTFGLPSFGGGGLIAEEEAPEAAPPTASAEPEPEADPGPEPDAAPPNVLQPMTVSGSIPGAATEAPEATPTAALTSARPEAGSGVRIASRLPNMGLLVNLLLPDTVETDTADQMVLIPDGTFILGLTDEDPLQLQTAGLRRITLSSFYIDQHEVSNGEYLRFINALPAQQRASLLPDTTMGQAGGNRFSWSEYLRGPAFADYPVVGVTHNQAQTYCASQGKRLPTEAEWEYAARGGQLGGVYPWAGLEPRDEQGRYLANYNPGRGGYAADGFAFTAPVESFPATRWQLYNVSGNVAEWVQDAFYPSYGMISDFNPLYEDGDEDMRIVRGGSWASDAFYIGVGVRDSHPANEPSPYIGFRCVKDISTLGPR